MLITMRPMAFPKSYHDDMLLVKVRPTLGAALTAGAAPAMSMMAAANLPATPGITTLAAFARAGLIRRVVPLAPAAPTVPAAGPLFALGTLAASSLSDPGRPSVNAGVNIVHLQSGTDLAQLQVSLANDVHIEAVARVPVRYLKVRRPARHGPAPKHRATRPAPPAAPVAAAVPPARETMWNLSKIQWRQARAAGLSPADTIRVAVLDTGVDLSHPDLPGRQINYVHKYPGGAAASDQDVVGHGTHVSGTIRALIDSDHGINGICQCKLSVYKIFDDQTTYHPGLNIFTYFVDPVLYHSALAACVDDGIQVINLSIGGYGEPDFQELQLFQHLLNQGVSIVAAMGNDHTGQLSYPAAIPGVIAVGAMAADDTVANFSNFGAHIALSAPGVGIWSTLPTYPGQSGFLADVGADGQPKPGQPIPRETDYDAWDGTSMATPHVTAAAACALGQAGAAVSPADMKSLLMKAVDRVPAMGGKAFTQEYGAGRLNLVQLRKQFP